MRTEAVAGRRPRAGRETGAADVGALRRREAGAFLLPALKTGGCFPRLQGELGRGPGSGGVEVKGREEELSRAEDLNLQLKFIGKLLG